MSTDPRDIVERLRNGAAPLDDPNLNDEAAGTIERLRADGPIIERGISGDGSVWMGTMREVMSDYRSAADIESRESDHWRAECLRLRAAAAALHELVELKALKEDFEAMNCKARGEPGRLRATLRTEYARLKPGIWAAARAADAALKEPSHG